MGARITKKERIAELATTGLDAATIAAIVESSPSSVRSVITQLRAEGANIPRARLSLDAPGQFFARIQLPDRLARTLLVEAASRGVSPSDLATMILARVLADNLVSSVLDFLPEKR